MVRGWDMVSISWVQILTEQFQEKYINMYHFNVSNDVLFLQSTMLLSFFVDEVLTLSLYMYLLSHLNL